MLVAHIHPSRSGEFQMLELMLPECSCCCEKELFRSNEYKLSRTMHHYSLTEERALFPQLRGHIQGETGPSQKSYSQKD